MRPEEAIAAARERGLTIACAESVTGGAVCSGLVSVPGASDAVAGGVVAYTVAAKTGVLGVDAAVIDRHGVVSEEVALAMAIRAQTLFGADVGVGTTGAAGPTEHGGKPAGTVCVASVGPGGQFSVTDGARRHARGRARGGGGRRASSSWAKRLAKRVHKS